MIRKETGILGEKLARDFLKKRGYRIIETNYRCRYGEIDIIARHKGYLIFIEVRTKPRHVVVAGVAHRPLVPALPLLRCR